MDKYDVSNDHYCYKGTATLRNKLKIHELCDLEVAERDITAVTIDNIHFKPPPYNLEYMKLLHHQLFSNLYDWAGELRNIDISKGGTHFCTSRRIVAESQKLFTSLQQENWLDKLQKEEFCDKLAEYYCEINMIHPFREGNGRVQRLFFEHLSLAAGYDLSWENIQPDEWVQANIDGVDVNYEPMKQIFMRIARSIANTPN